MDNITQPNPLPEKVLRRHFEILSEIIPDLTDLVLNAGRPADVLLNHYLRTHRELGSRDRRFLSQAVFSYFRWYGWTVGTLGLKSAEACLLGAMLDSTALSPSFEYIRSRTSLPEGTGAIGDRSLPEKRDCLIEWFGASPTQQPAALEGLVPASFPELVDPRAVEPSIDAFQQRPPSWIRTRVEAAEISAALSGRDTPHQVHPRINNALSVTGGVNLGRELEDKAGQFVVQDIASQCVGLVCSPAAGEEWWDCCAGAGGKALHLMDLMEQQGRILATDVRLDALKELKKRARHHGIRHIRTQPFHAANDEPFRKTFDGVLVDAPCSGWGTWGRNPDARWRTSDREAAQCANRQLKILNNVRWCVKPGGVLVYAVCTMTRPETEEVVMNFLDQHTDFRLDPFMNPLNGQETGGQLQIWPWDGPGDAMFIARMIRQPE